MNSSTIASQQLTKYVTIMILVLTMVALSYELPSSSTLVNNRLFAHMIRTRSLPKRYCGRHIINILSLLCDGNYFGPSKRNHLNVNNNENAITSFWEDMNPKVEYTKPEDRSEDYIIGPKEALDMFESQSSDHFARKRRGIVDECCRKACTIRELTSYCE